MKPRATLLAIALLLGFAPLRASDPLTFFLTWRDSPCTTMVIDWHLPADGADPGLFFRRKGAGGWEKAEGARFDFPFSDRKVVRAELSGLRPGSTYEFRFGGEGQVRTFRTMPETLDRPLRFAIGGDTRHTASWFEAMNRIAASRDPEFVVLGGDLAYENGKPEGVESVTGWFDACAKTLVRDDGRVLPVLVAIGNHEVQGGFITGKAAEALRAGRPGISADQLRSAIAPYFFTLFASPGQPGYRAIDFGDYLSIILLDTNHANAIEGPQTDWLAKSLDERRGRAHIFPVYHVPAYPSVRPFEDPVSALVRKNWVPLFEKSGVRLAFENHDHAFKRTKPIREGKPAEDGIVYLGDGAWGVETRTPHADSWYLEKAAGVRHCIVITLDAGTRSGVVIDEAGREIDAF